MTVEQKLEVSKREAVALRVVELVEATVEDRVLVLGSLPPGGRDLELVVRPRELAAIAERLTADGFARRGLEWAWFFEGTAYAVELVPASRLALGGHQLEALFADARPVDRLAAARIVRPAPYHLLLLQARRLIRDGELPQKRRPRVAGALSEDPDAWAKARGTAPDWGLKRALHLLEKTFLGDVTISRAERASALLELVRFTAGTADKLDLVCRPFLPTVPRRNRIVAISGLDGAGKTAQAQTLRKTLELLVVPAVVEWRPLGQNRTLDVLRLVKRPFRGDEWDPWEVDGALPPIANDSLGNADLVRSFRERTALLTHLWATFVALANVGFHWRWSIRHPFGRRVVIYDRCVCDSAAQLDFWYGRNRDLRFEKWLLRVLSPRPAHAFYLAVPPEVALIRKAEYPLSELRRQAEVYRTEATRLGVSVLDGERPPAELAAQIARAVWESLPPHTEGFFTTAATGSASSS
jgi:thymidylate kinase